MNKTIITALRDTIHYPLKQGFIENTLIERGLNYGDDFNTEVAKSNAYRGAVADCIVGLILSPNVSEGDMNISLTYKDMMLKRANSIYVSIGEEAVDFANKPAVYIEN